MRLLLILLSIVVLSGCGGPGPTDRTLEVVATEMQFTPDTLRAKVGEMVFIRIKNQGKVAHNLVVALPSGDRRVSADPGVDAVLAFPAPPSGTYRFYCNIPGHEAQTGTLIVEP